MHIHIHVIYIYVYYTSRSVGWKHPLQDVARMVWPPPPPLLTCATVPRLAAGEIFLQSHNDSFPTTQWQFLWWFYVLFDANDQCYWIYIYIIYMYVCIYWLHKSIYEYINRYKISNQIHYHYFDQWDAGWDPRRSFLRVAPQLACSVFQTFLVRNDLLGSKISNVPGKNACSMCFFSVSGH